MSDATQCPARTFLIYGYSTSRRNLRKITFMMIMVSLIFWTIKLLKRRAISTDLGKKRLTEIVKKETIFRETKLIALATTVMYNVHCRAVQMDFVCSLHRRPLNSHQKFEYTAFPRWMLQCYTSRVFCLS